LYNYTKKNLDVIANETGFIRDNLEKVLLTMTNAEGLSLSIFLFNSASK
jgi:hypothetical protein